MSDFPDKNGGFTDNLDGYRPKVSQSRIARIITDCTSGTTGQSKRVYYTASDLERTVNIFMKGISELGQEKILVAFPSTGEFSLGSLICQAVRQTGCKPVMLEADLSYLNIVDIIEKEKPGGFIGFPQLLLALQRITGGCFSAGLISGDYCIKADYMCPVFPHYGSREMGLAGAISCRCREGMHMRPDVIIEIIHNEGKPVPDGFEGELVISTPQMEAMPLLRYRTGDYTYIIPDACSCGSEWVRIGPVRRKTAIEAFDDKAFEDSSLLDIRGEKRITLANLKADDKPLFKGKRH